MNTGIENEHNELKSGFSLIIEFFQHEFEASILKRSEKNFPLYICILQKTDISNCKEASLLKIITMENVT